MKIRDNLRACVDCLYLVANGELPGDTETTAEEHGAKMTAHLGNVGHLVCGDSEFDEEFSSRPCECCGSHLAGSRHELILLEEDK